MAAFEDQVDIDFRVLPDGKVRGEVYEKGKPGVMLHYTKWYFSYQAAVDAAKQWVKDQDTKPK